MGVNEPPAGDRGLELLAQLPDVNVHRAVRLAIRLAPDLAIELLTRDDAVAPLHQGGEQLQLPHGEVQALPTDQDQELAWAQLELACPQRWSLKCRFHAAQRSS